MLINTRECQLYDFINEILMSLRRNLFNKTSTQNMLRTV